MRDLDGEVAVVADNAGGELGGGGVEFVELPLREGRIEPGHAAAGDGAEASWDDDAESMEDTAAIAVGTAVVEPEDAEGQASIDHGGEFFRADAEDGPGGLAFGENAAGVGGPEAVLEVHGGAESFGSPAWEVRGERLLEGAEVAAAGGITRCSGAEVRVRDEGEGLGFRLAEAPGFKAERLAARLNGGNSADKVLLVGP